MMGHSQLILSTGTRLMGQLFDLCRVCHKSASQAARLSPSLFMQPSTELCFKPILGIPLTLPLGTQDAADLGRLGASTFKALNLALFVASLAQANVLGRAYLAGALELRTRACSLLVVAVGQALLAGYQYSTAKKR